MLDTIILQIPIKYSAIIDHNQFEPSTRSLLNYQGFVKHTNNPSSEDRKKGIYKPRLTIFKRGRIIYLKMEFSANKIINNENKFYETEEPEFENVVNNLRKVVKDMGVLIWRKEIINAEVFSFHPSKNILITQGYTASLVIRELSKINLSKVFDLENRTYRNNGEALQFYTNSHSFVIYDKTRDLSKPPKRAIDKNQTEQLSLFSNHREEKLPEVLRMEVRLSKKKRMNEVLEKVGHTTNPSFKDIFKKDLCKKIVNLYWNDFFKKDLFLFSINNSPQKILQLILKKYAKTKPKTAIFLSGLMLLCKDDEGIRGFRQIIEAYKPKTSWLALKRYLRKFEDEIFTEPAHGFIRDIEKAINEFKAFKLIK
jgi:hypothetical protein